MVKRFWVCRVDGEPVLGFDVGMEFMISFNTQKETERYVKMSGELYPSSTLTILEVWQKEVE